MVLVTHGLGGFAEVLQYPLWIGQAVPLFLLIQVFHVYKKEDVCFPKPSKLWHRIVKPFLIVQLVFLAMILVSYAIKDIDLKSKLFHMLAYGGNGPGSYYIWVYLQIAILSPLLYRWVRNKYAFVIFAGISIMLEVFCSLMEMPDEIYRLLCFRYVFLIYLGYLWVRNDGILLNRKTVSLSVISSVAIVILNYTHLNHPEFNFEPLVFDTAWTTFHWFTYFLPWSLLAFIICKCYQWEPECMVNQLVLLCGKRSYEIFLWQMLVFGMSPLPGYANILLSLLPLVVYERKRVMEICKTKNV